MAKAWRNESARKINERRAEGIKKPNARDQMRGRPTTKDGGGNWLLSGLMVHAGYIPATPGVPNTEVPLTEGLAKRVSRAFRQWWARCR